MNCGMFFVYEMIFLDICLLVYCFGKNCIFFNIFFFIENECWFNGYDIEIKWVNFIFIFVLVYFINISVFKFYFILF